MLQAKIIHSRETCLRLALVQDKCFGRTRQIVRVILGLIPAVIGYFVGYDKIWGILLLVLGVMLYWTSGGMYERDAEKAFRMTPEKYRKVDYYFRENDILVESGGAKKDVAYSTVLALVTDGFSYYLFVNPQQAYMMELKNVSRKEEEQFEAFLSGKTGKKWKTVIAREPFLRALRKQEKTGREK